MISSRNLRTSTILFDEIKVVVCPAFAESITEGDLRWEKAAGDAVAEDEVIKEIELTKNRTWKKICNLNTYLYQPLSLFALPSVGHKSVFQHFRSTFRAAIREVQLHKYFLNHTCLTFPKHSCALPHLKIHYLKRGAFFLASL